MAKKLAFENIREKYPINSWDAVDALLRRLGEIQIAVQKIEGEMTLKINEIKDAADIKSEGLRREYDDIERSIAAFVEVRRDEFVKTRSKELTFGTVAYRVVSRIVIKSKQATVAALEALGLTSYLRIVKEVDKEAMGNLDAQTLAKVGASLKTDDRLKIEANLERLKDAN